MVHQELLPANYIMAAREHNKRRGFTLIELLVVVAIVSLLSSAVFASLSSARMKARDVRRYTDLNQIHLALELYRDTNGAYPITPTWWSVCPGGLSHTTSGASGYIPNLAPTYIAVLPTDPLGCVAGGVGGYIYFSNGTDYKVAVDWGAEIGTLCRLGRKFADPPRTTASAYTFCSVYTSGASGW